MTECKPIFSANPLDRMDHQRNEIAVARLSADCRSKSKYILLCKGEVIFNQASDSCYFTPEQMPQSLLTHGLWVFLGGKDEQYYFAMAITSKALEQAQQQLAWQARHIRALVGEQLLSEPELAVTAQANSLLTWHFNHSFCAKCGHKSKPAHGGWRRDCNHCHTEHFPRTDPVVIMLVTHGTRCLLGRGVDFESKRYSCLAGFMEPGETIEQASRRELFEEAGVQGGKVQFMLDQPWPFPSNLMIGVHVEALSEQINIDPNEIADAMWVEKADIKAVLAGAEDPRFELPPRVAIARNLLETWVNELDCN